MFRSLGLKSIAGYYTHSGKWFCLSAIRLRPHVMAAIINEREGPDWEGEALAFHH